MYTPPHSPDASHGAHLIGTQVGHYRITQYIGAGGMAQVYAGEHVNPQVGSKVAIKILLQEHCDKPDIVNRFINEAKALGRISHPGVVDVFDVVQLPSGRVCMIMEYLPGQTMQAWRKQRGRIPIGEAIPIMLQLTEAVGAAHAQRIIHRDIKPDNVFLIPEPGGLRVKVLDFGIAKLLEGAGHVQTMTRTAMGTAAYMAPEQFRSARDVDHRSDIYSLGCVFFEMLAGRGPFLGKNLVQFMRMHQSDPVPPLTTYAPEVPRPIEDVILCMLQKDPDLRFDSMAEVKAAIEEAIGMRPARTGATVVTPAVPDPRGSNRAGLIIAIAVALVVIAACVILVLTTG